MINIQSTVNGETVNVQTYVGTTLSIWEKNGHSDFIAMVYDTDTNTCKVVESTRGWTYGSFVVVDATPEIIQLAISARLPKMVEMIKDEVEQAGQTMTESQVNDMALKLAPIFAPPTGYSTARIVARIA